MGFFFISFELSLVAFGQPHKNNAKKKEILNKLLIMRLLF